MNKIISLFLIALSLIIVYITIFNPTLWVWNSYPQSGKSLDTLNADSLYVNDTLFLADIFSYPSYGYTPDVYIQGEVIEYMIVNGDTIRNIKGEVRVIMKEDIDLLSKDKISKYYYKNTNSKSLKSKPSEPLMINSPAMRDDPVVLEDTLVSIPVYNSMRCKDNLWLGDALLAGSTIQFTTKKIIYKDSIEWGEYYIPIHSMVGFGNTQVSYK